MAKLPGTIYLKTPDKETDILTFGKSLEVSEKDSKEGLSRFGGFARQPSYAQAYLKAANIVLDKAQDIGELDELGLPIFYLVRHTLELKIKSLLEMTYEIFDMTLKCFPDRYSAAVLPSISQKKRLKESHDLEKLFRDLGKSCNTLGISVPMESFLSVISIICEFEINPTWSRYSKSDSDFHVEKEVALPIIQLARNLETLFEVLSYEQPDDAESLESELYILFTSLNTRLEEEDL